MSEIATSKTADIYKIVPAELWAGAVSHGVFRGSADDLRDGFVHLSNAQQLQGTARKYFSGQADLLLIAFAVASLVTHLKWEVSRGGDLFPHYYGALPVNCALWQRPLSLDADGTPVIDEDNL